MPFSPTSLADLVGRFAAALHRAGLPVGPDRAERFTRAIGLLDPQTVDELHRCARTTLVSDPAHFEILDAVFDAVFRGYEDIAEFRGDLNAQGTSTTTRSTTSSPSISDGSSGSDGSRQEVIDVPVGVAGSAAERLAARDFATLSEDELARLADLMRRLRFATPPRRSRRFRPAADGRLVDLRAALRRARRTGGEPLRLPRRAHREKPRRLVVLCDISGSMEPYARAMIQLLYCAAGASRAEVFTFATRLTRLTRLLARRTRPAVALHRAGQAAPDWSGGTRIGAALKRFNDDHGRRGLARGAVVLIVSDGWETGDPAQVGAEMARLSRLAHRIVWVNPRTQSPRYRPLVGGMAAAWPHCDAVVSGHSLTAVEPLLDALTGGTTAHAPHQRVRRRPPHR